MPSILLAVTASPEWLNALLSSPSVRTLVSTALVVLALWVARWVLQRINVPAEAAAAIKKAVRAVVDEQVARAAKTLTPWDDVAWQAASEVMRHVSAAGVVPTATVRTRVLQAVDSRQRALARRARRAGPETRAALLVAVALSSLGASPALAAESKPLHVPLVWSTPRVEPGLTLLAPTPSVPLVWLRPSLDVQVAVRDGLTRQWTVGLSPGVTYGIAWCPPGWRFTPELLALDIHVGAGLTEGTLRGRALLMLTLGGLVTLGGGVDLALGSGDAPDQAGLAIAAGIRYAL